VQAAVPTGVSCMFEYSTFAEPGINDKAWERSIVLHGAAYVSNTVIRTLGRIGRSFGCPAVRPEISRAMIDTLRGGSPVFAYYPTIQG
jgi:L,D-transpeptidase catalytic domain